MLTLVASALAGGDCIDDADVLRTGGTAGAVCSASHRSEPDEFFEETSQVVQCPNFVR